MDNEDLEMNSEEVHKPGTRIFKKSTPNGKLTIYLGKRDFMDHLTHVDPIEGVVLVDPDYVRNRKVFVHLLGAFWYGRDEVDLLGLNYHKDLCVMTKQVYPPISSKGVKSYMPTVLPGNGDTNELSSILPYKFTEPPGRTRLQERLIRKLGSNAYPFYFQLPAYSPASVSLLLNPSDRGKRCRVEYELKVYVADDQDDKPQKRNSVRMVVRKLTYAPNEPGQQPSAELSRDFLMSVGSLRVEATLDKNKYYHGEKVFVNLLVDNNSNKTIKRVKLSVRQYTQIYVQSPIHFKCSIDEIQSEERFPILPSQTGWCKVYRLCPSLTCNRDKIGIAMDGDLKQEDTNLASSTISPPNSTNREPVGIIVEYKVKIRLVLGFGISDVCLELPFLLTHPNPDNSNTNGDRQDGELISSITSEPSLNEKSSDKRNASNLSDVKVNPSTSVIKPSTTVNRTPIAIPKPDPSFLSSQQNNSNDPNHFSANHHANESLQSSKFVGKSICYSPPVWDRNFHLMLSGLRSSTRRPSTVGTQSTLSEDDLLFEDFARFRLQS
ncbi:Arrestin red cell isoform 2 isoform 1 [Schistosoma japonicum]|uniref:Arrestin red cell isoform 2 isoform 1 n=3 Tax=Schistosoma japonicum TaxID=6182 RepID=A0A4Z2DWD7_SCHJA|nr:Beta-arrestin-2 [Schistosoma japonicum]TNN20873.1 Arrestin red cell isoform 2 isoform 1 [Schistosoma japonicum]